jgi:hypothetical protein
VCMHQVAISTADKFNGADLGMCCAAHAATNPQGIQNMRLS